LAGFLPDEANSIMRKSFYDTAPYLQTIALVIHKHSIPQDQMSVKPAVLNLQMSCIFGAPAGEKVAAVT
jgi:hypothetical protein